MLPATRTSALRSLKPNLKITYFEDEEVEAMRKYITDRITTDRGQRSLYYLRYKLLLEVLLRTGARIEEVVRYERPERTDKKGKFHKAEFYPGVTIKDIDVTLNTISLLTLKKSGGKPHRVLPLHPALRAEITGYTHELGQKGILLSPKDPMFPMSRNAVDRFFKRMQENLGFKIHAHKFRHTFAVRALLDGVPVNVLQKWLAHSSLIVTSVYVDVIGMDTADFMNKVH